MTIKTVRRAVLCAEIGSVRLFQLRRDEFAVQYGKQVKEGLTYQRAAEELGACIMHELACEGRLNNSDAPTSQDLPNPRTWFVNDAKNPAFTGNAELRRRLQIEN